MILDGHIHIGSEHDNSARFRQGIGEAGVGGGLVISLAPNCFSPGAEPGNAECAIGRLDGLFLRTQGDPDLFPFFWIDPMEEDALDQVDIACGRGVMGFKVICDHYYAYDERPMAVFRRIAERGKPILFHSGILWDGKFSSLYNRPANFEALIEIPGMRFSLAHASWPWCDECIALYGKFLNAGGNAEMFIDITPGTPEIYRRELLTKLFTVGYDVENNIIFGADCAYDDYAGHWAKKWIETDSAIYADLNLGQSVIDKVFGGNLRRFVGVSKEEVAHRKITPTG